MIKAAPEKHLWAESYERDLRDILALQSDVARAIAAQVHVTLTPQQQQRLRSVHPVDPEAHRAYSKAKFFLHNQRSAEGVRKAFDYALQATQLDANSAPAFAVLSECYTTLAYFQAKPHDVMPKARAAAERALALDPDLAEAHAALGEVLFVYARDWPGAKREAKRALELNPSDSRAHELYGRYLQVMGQMDEAVAEMKRARELDPLSMVSNRDLGIILYLARRYDEAIAEWQQTAEMFPNSEVVFNWLSMVYRVKGNVEKSVEMDLKHRANMGESPERIAALRRIFEASGMQFYWEKSLELKRVQGIPCAEANIALGRKQEAFACLERSYQDGSLPPYIKFDARLDPIRSDPRFQDLVRRMGLPP